MSSIKSFKGLNNVSDPLRLGLSWLAQADNIDITDTGAVKKRSGYSKTLAGTFTGAYATLDFARMFVVDGGVLKALTGPASAVPLLGRLSAAPMHFTEINQQVFFNNGVDRGVILPDNTVIDWAWQAAAAPNVAAVTGSLPAGLYQVRCTFTLADGRETGAGESAEITLADGQALQISGIDYALGAVTNTYIAPADSSVFQLARRGTASAFVWNNPPDDLGIDLNTNFLDPLPRGADVIQAWKGRIYAAQYFAESNQSAIWFSKPLGFHLFNYNSGFFLVPGRVLMLAPTDDALIIGTEARIWSYLGDKLEELAPYGVVPGWHWAKDDERTLFWTTRGLCAALPFSNLTERQVSVAPGISAGGAVVRHGGQKRYLVALHRGGSVFNSHT